MLDALSCHLPDQADQRKVKIRTKRDPLVAVDGPHLDRAHSLWDGLLGTGTVADAGLTRSALNDAIRLQALHPRATLPELQSHRSVKSWSKESRESAIHDAYFDGTLPSGENATHATILPTGYTRHAKEIAERRVALAGYRLADEIRRTIR